MQNTSSRKNTRKMEYRPLCSETEEIRLITILPDTSSSLEEGFSLCCTIEHFSLQSQIYRSSDRHPQFKGSTYIWPEAYQPVNGKVLFKHQSHPLSTIPLTRPSGSSSPGVNISSEENLHWRYPWGDYIALSYVWGPPTPKYLIILNDKPFQVTKNLYYALKQLQRSERVRQGFKIWVDAICINQDDLEERSKQVARMRDIYAGAWQVVMWFGEQTASTDLALTAVRWMSTRMQEKDPLEEFYYATPTVDMRPLFIIWSIYRNPWKREVYKALYHLILGTYWHRLWILQEIALAREDAPVLCGDRCVLWKEIDSAARFIASDEARFGRDLIKSVRPWSPGSWSWEFARDRVIDKRDYASDKLWLRLMKMMVLQQKQRELVDPGDIWDILDPLVLSREADVTQQVDRVYGVLGIRSIGDSVDIKPDYTLSLSEVYTSFSQELLSHGKLDILRLVSRPIAGVDHGWKIGEIATLIFRLLRPLRHQVKKSTSYDASIIPPCHHNLPSWAVCWTCPQCPVVQLPGHYKAGGSHFPTPKFTYSPPTMTLKGVFVDTITSLSSYHPYESDKKYPLNSPLSKTKTKIAYGNFQATRTALWKSITANTNSEGTSKAPDSYEWLLTPELWHEYGGVAGILTNNFGLHDFMSRNKNLILSSYTLQELIFGQKSQKLSLNSTKRLYNLTEEQRDALSWAMNILAWRRLIGTEGGRIGLGCAAAEIGDRVLVVLGGGMPVLVRGRGEGGGWLVVGEVFLLGVMDGEVGGMVERGEGEVVDVRLY